MITTYCCRRHMRRTASTGHLSRVVSRLRAETGDRDIYRWYQVADALHGNFYEDETAEDIDDSLKTWSVLLDKLEPVLG